MAKKLSEKMADLPHRKREAIERRKRELLTEEIERLQAEITHQKNVISRYRRLASGKAALLAQHGIQETTDGQN